MLEKYIDKVINNKDYINGLVMTDYIPYDNRYFIIELLKEMDKEYSEKYCKLIEEIEDLEWQIDIQESDLEDYKGD